MDYIKLIISAIIGGVLVLGGFLLLNQAKAGTFGAAVAANVTTVGNPWVFTSSQKIGSSGTALSNRVVATCSMIANNASVGTTTQYAYCTGVTGVVSTDLIVASFATSSTAFADSWQIVGAKASSTAGVIDFAVIGKAGVALSAGTTVGSTTVISASH